MKPGGLALGAAVVLAAVIALYFAARSDDPVPGFTQAEPGKASNGSRPAGPATMASGDVTPPAVRPGREVTDYMVGSARVRDHRSGERTPDVVPRAAHPPEGRKIASQLTSDVAQKVRAAMTECAMNLPRDARGADPRLDGTVEIAIKDRQATITSASVQLRDVQSSAADSLKRCVEQKSVGVATSAGEEADVAGYAIAVAFRVH
jgi:hypothetical protein